MSRMCLSDYFEKQRPQVVDICIIMRAVINVARRQKNVCINMEKVYYDPEYRKVYFSVDKRKQITHQKDVCQLIDVICSMCRYAGDNVYEIMMMIKEMTDKGEYSKCMEYVESFLSDSQRGKKASYILFIMSIVLFEIIYLAAAKVRF